MELLDSIEKLKNDKVKKLVDSRVREFQKVGNSSGDEIFQELCFCLLTANFNAGRAMGIQDKIGNGFCNLPEKELAGKLKFLGHRYPNARANYISEARKHKDSLRNILKTKNGTEIREWLVRNVKGLGYKEASHFLRNTGFQDLAIIDFHIMDLLAREGIIEKPKTLTKRKYLEIETLLREIAGKTGLTLAELDLYLWYMETGRVLK